MSLHGYFYDIDKQIVDRNNPVTNREIILITKSHMNLKNLNEFLVQQADPNNEEITNVSNVPNVPNREFPQNLINNLVKIYATFNKIEILPSLTPLINLKELHVDSNQLADLPELPTSLTILSCSVNNLTYLPDLQSLNNLKYLNIYGNKLTELPDLPPNLIDLICNNNNIEQLPKLPSRLTLLACRYNPTLKSLPELPITLKTLYCDNCQLTTLPTLSNTSLKWLNCENNKLTALPQLPDTIEELFCINNNIKKIENLPKSLKKIKFEKNDNLNYDALIKIINCYNNIARNIGHDRFNMFGMDSQVSHYMVRAKKMNKIGWIIDLSLRRQNNSEELPPIARNKILQFTNARSFFNGKEGGKKKTKNRKNKKLHRKTKKTKKTKDLKHLKLKNNKKLNYYSII